MPKAFRTLAHSEIGLVRKNNQDSGYVSATMLMVADGMGGAAAGDLASAVAIKELEATDGNFTGKDMLEVVAGALARANDKIADLVEADPAVSGMGTTVCGLLFDGESAALANIGDSRGYLVRDGVMRRITRDHSWVQTLVDEGRITEAEALVHPHRSLILRVLNGHSTNSPDLDTLDVEVGDRLLLCSDGLCGLVTDAAIEEVVLGADPAVAMEQLIRMAHAAGGYDNITIILADVVDGEPGDEHLVLGAAAELDLSARAEDTAVIATIDVTPRPDPDRASKAERLRYAPTDRGRAGAWTKGVLSVLVPLLLVGGGGYGWYTYLQSKVYVGASGEQVAIFRGDPSTVAGIELHSVLTPADILVADLPHRIQDEVRAGIPSPDYTAAQNTVAELRTFAEECIALRAQVTATPSTTPSASTTPSTKATGSPRPSASPSASPSPSPSASPTPTELGDC